MASASGMAGGEDGRGSLSWIQARRGQIERGASPLGAWALGGGGGAGDRRRACAEDKQKTAEYGPQGPVGDGAGSGDFGCLPTLET